MPLPPLSSPHFRTFNKAEPDGACPYGGSSGWPANMLPCTAAGAPTNCCVSSSQPRAVRRIRSNRRSAANQPVRGLSRASFGRRRGPVQAASCTCTRKYTWKAFSRRYPECVEAEKTKTRETQMRKSEIRKWVRKRKWYGPCRRENRRGMVLVGLCSS